MSASFQRAVPDFLRERLFLQYGEALTQAIFSGYGAERPVSFRVNPFKAGQPIEALKREGIAAEGVPWYCDAYLTNVREERLQNTEVYRSGAIYLQSLSSMLPPLILGADAGENILDMTAAPGGKTTQLSALSGGKALITACEKNPMRFERLKFNVERQGAPRVTLLKTDALQLNEYFRFDKILLDAPCSGSGTLRLRRPSPLSERLIENSARLQKALIKKALSLLKKGGTLVYSTCSVLRCENEEALEASLRSGEAELISLDGAIEGLPLLPSAQGTLCVLPDEHYEGFFVAKLKKQ